MKVHTIEIAGAIEAELKKFLADWGSGYAMRFTRFVDLGGKQTDLYVYPPPKDSSPWMIVRIKSVFKSEQGECMQCFVNLVGTTKNMEEVMVSPEIWKLPALADRILKFAKNDLLVLVSQSGGALDQGSESADTNASLGGGSSRAEEEEEDEFEDLDTSGILAGDSGGGSLDFNPEDVIAAANAGGDEDMDPSELLKQFGAEEDEEEEKGK